ncbi:MAG: hypothetical protein ACK479_06760 [Fluviicola sp.]
MRRIIFILFILFLFTYCSSKKPFQLRQTQNKIKILKTNYYKNDLPDWAISKIDAKDQITNEWLMGDTSIEVNLSDVNVPISKNKKIYSKEFVFHTFFEDSSIVVVRKGGYSIRTFIYVFDKNNMFTSFRETMEWIEKPEDLFSR